MRVYGRRKGISVLAISGTYVVQLAFDVTAAKRKGLLGFAIHRQDHTEDEQYWLRGFKTFKQTFPNPSPGSLVSTLEHPVQGFLWGDYTAKPDHKYTYTVVPMYGQPKNLKEGPRVVITIETPGNDMDETHTIVFNRGVAGSQAYARRFGNVSPRNIKDPKKQAAAYRWLSRGLEEAILAFIGQAKSKKYGLRASVYEFNWAPVLDAFKKAHDQGADVRIIYDRRKRGPFEATEKAAEKAGLLNLDAHGGGKVMIRRETNSAISHNKFIVLLENGKPTQVWTGSTNYTEGGIFGQSNVGHQIRDENIAQAYFDYWTRLSVDPEFKDIRTGNDAANTIPRNLPPNDSLSAIFSPQGSLRALEWYGERMDGAKQTLGFTAAFGISKTLAPILLEQKPYLRYIMVESEGSKRVPKATPENPNPKSQFETFQEIEALKNNRVAMGSYLKTAEDDALGGELHRFVSEGLTGLNVHVRYLHTKYMFADPLTRQPLVISGSANFSDASTRKNDENMVVIRGNTNVADSFFGEFMRLFNHFYFRTVIQRHAAMQANEAVKSEPYLDPDDSWTDAYFTEGTDKYMERKLYVQGMKGLPDTNKG